MILLIGPERTGTRRYGYWCCHGSFSLCSLLRRTQATRQPGSEMKSGDGTRMSGETGKGSIGRTLRKANSIMSRLWIFSVHEVEMQVEEELERTEDAQEISGMICLGEPRHTNPLHTVTEHQL